MTGVSTMYISNDYSIMNEIDAESTSTLSSTPITPSTMDIERPNVEWDYPFELNQDFSCRLFIKYLSSIS